MFVEGEFVLSWRFLCCGLQIAHFFIGEIRCTKYDLPALTNILSAHRPLHYATCNIADQFLWATSQYAQRFEANQS